MPITIESSLSGAEATMLAGVLHCSEAELDTQLAALATAALEEYTRMFLGQRVFTRGSDIREYRLFLLIKGPFGGDIPTEQRVSDLFQTTNTESRSLLRSVMSKYQYELQDEISGTLQSVVASAGAISGENERRITVDSPNLIEALNRVIAGLDPTLPRIEKERGTVASFLISASAYEALTSHYHV